MSDTGKTITISHEAYLEIKRLNENNAALVKRWVELVEWVAQYAGHGSGNEFHRGTIKAKMKELEGGE